MQIEERRLLLEQENMIFILLNKWRIFPIQMSSFHLVQDTLFGI